MVHLQENLTHKFVKRGSWMYLFAFLSGPIGYAIKIIISHDLSVSELGILYGVLSFILLVASLNDLGMVESLNYFVPKFIAQEKNEKVKSFFIYGGLAMFITSLLSGSLLYLFSDLLAGAYFWAMEAGYVLQAFCIYLLLNNFQHYLATIFIIYQNTKFSRWLEALRLLISLGFAYQVFATGNGGISEYAVIWNYGVAAAVAFWGYYAWKLHLREAFLGVPFHFSRHDIRELFGYSMWALLANNATLLLSQIDTQLLLVMRGVEDVGIYSNYLSLIAIPFIVLTPIMGLIAPVVSAYHWAERKTEIITIASTFSQIFSLLWLIVMGMTLLYAPWSGIFFFGDKFEASGYILYYSTWFIIFNFLLQINFNILGAIGKVKKRLKIISIWLIVNILLNILAIKIAGVGGSAFAVGASWVVLWALSHFETREYHAPFFWKTFFKNLFFYTILTAVLWHFAPRDIGEMGKVGYFLSLSVSALLFFWSFILLNRHDCLRIYRTLKQKNPWVQTSS